MSDEQKAVNALLELTPQQLYQLEMAKALERWERRGGPSCGLTSGRRPLVRGAA